MRASLAIAVLMGICGLSAAAFASAWTQAAGHGFYSLSNIYYRTDSYYNSRGDRVSQSYYRKYEINPYIEYGLRDDITIGANLFFQHITQDTPLGLYSSWGVADSEFFLRKKIWEKNGFVLSAEPMVKLPSPTRGSLLPRIGSQHPDAAMGISAGYGFSALGLNHFANLDSRYRYRLGMPLDQFNLDGTIGVHVHEKWLLLPQFFFTKRMDSRKNTLFTQTSGDDYDLAKLQFSVVYEFSEKTALQLGAFGNIAGKNVGNGDGMMLSLWKRF